MAESLSKQLGTRSVYICHIENLGNEIEETIANFNIKTYKA